MRTGSSAHQPQAIAINLCRVRLLLADKHIHSFRKLHVYRTGLLDAQDASCQSWPQQSVRQLLNC